MIANNYKFRISEYRPSLRSAVLQIIPETRNVTAVYLENGKEEEYPVICWALIEVYDEDESTKEKYRYQDVVGMTTLDSSSSLDAIHRHQGENGTAGFLRYSIHKS